MTLQTLGAAFAMTLALTACASSPSRLDQQHEELARFEKHAGEPVERVRPFQGVDRWQALSSLKLVIWSGVNRAFLLTMRAPCTGLEFQNAIVVTSTNNIIDVHFDSVRFEQQVCFLSEIRPVDYKALQQERRGAKKSP